MNHERVRMIPPIAFCTDEIRRLHASMRRSEIPAFVYRGKLILDLDRLSQFYERMN